MKSGTVFAPYIDYIRFPRFRNLEPNSKIDFTFPLTVFVGQNGCGKSSALQALFGCPKGKSVATYWFSTSVDPIKDLAQEDRHCLIYSYDGGGMTKEVLKTRINKEGHPDLWDTSEPIARYSMQMGSRSSPIEKDVIYVNFRAVQSAFEKAFHEERPPASGIQQHLRYRSWYLRRLLTGHRKLPHFKGKTHDPAVQLNAIELAAASKILGRAYNSATILHHRIFDHWGYSVILTTPHASYSEAFAGSGETAVVLLVHEVLQSSPKSLLLLDEPETSLHPGAQRQVLDFLLQECVRAKHQIIICTHAPALVETLPGSALKVFTPKPTGDFRIVQDVLPHEAFYYLGQPLPDKKTLIVEDRLANLLVDEVLEKMGASIKNLFDVRHHPGGQTVMKQDAVVYAREVTSKTFLLFDGDQKPASDIFDPGMIPTAIDDDPEQAIPLLTQKIHDATGTTPKFPVDGGTGGGNRAQTRDLMKGYLRYFRASVFFLPTNSLEEALWNQAIAEGFLNSILPPVEVSSINTALAAEASFKKKFVILAESLCNTSSGSALDIFHMMLIKAWITHGPQSLADTIQILTTIKNRNNAP